MLLFSHHGLRLAQRLGGLARAEPHFEQDFKRSIAVQRSSDISAVDLPPIFSHVPLATYFHSAGSLSALLDAAHACFAVPQSFWPAFATP